MLRYVEGDLPAARIDALVNAVHIGDVMGKGIALAISQRFALNYRLYAAACRAGQVQTGRVFVTETDLADGPRWIVDLPTKQRWSAPSRLEWAVDGLEDPRCSIEREPARSIAVSALGMGRGGLACSDVREQIEIALGDVEASVYVYVPLGHRTETQGVP